MHPMHHRRSEPKQQQTFDRRCASEVIGQMFRHWRPTVSVLFNNFVPPLLM
jgi:hypothetical protein